MKVRYWKNYQHKIKKLSLRMVNYNKFNHFNLFEVEPYNHVRDILCLSLIQLSKRKKKNKNSGLR